MSIYCVHSQTYWQPAEHESDNPVRCIACGEEYDFDDQSREFVILRWEKVERRSLLGKPYMDSVPVIQCVECKP